MKTTKSSLIVVISFLVVGVFGYMFFSNFKIRNLEIENTLSLADNITVNFTGTVISNVRLCYLEDNGYVVSIIEKGSSDPCKYKIGERLLVRGSIITSAIKRVLVESIEVIGTYNASKPLTIQPKEIPDNPSRLIVIKDQILLNTSILPLSETHGDIVIKAAFEEFFVAIANSYLDEDLIEGRKYEIYGFVWPGKKPFIYGIKITPSE